MGCDKALDGLLRPATGEFIYKYSINIETDVGNAADSLFLRKLPRMVNIQFAEPRDTRVRFDNAGKHRLQIPARLVPVGVKIHDVDLARLGYERLEIHFADILNRRIDRLATVDHRVKIHTLDSLGAFLTRIHQLVHLVTNGVDMVAGAQQWH